MELIQLLIAVVLPTFLGLIFSGKLKDRNTLTFSLIAICTLILYIVVLSLGETLKTVLDISTPLQWNWFGKLSAISLCLIVYALLPVHLKVESGIFSIPRTNNWSLVLKVSSCFLLFFWTLAFPTRSGEELKLETILFQSTMPGLDEELFFRGVFLALLVSAFGKPYRFAGIQIGWGALPIVLFFGIAHGIGADYNSDLMNKVLLPILGASVMGAGLLWIKEKTQSVWIAVIVHNLANVGSQTIDTIPIFS